MPPIFWTQKQDIGPTARTWHGMAYDAARQRAVVFGGEPGGGPLADTWTWDGSLWTQAADIGPSARYGTAMAYEPPMQQVALFGGSTGSTLLGDSWIWDGTEWTQAADTGPQARARHAMAYDTNRHRLVLFGGTGAAPLGDTWEASGGEWTQIQDTGPSARSGHAMAFDPASGRVLLFGGAGADGAGLGDTWSWDGAAWTQLDDTGPDARVGAAMVGAYSSVLLHGGVNSVDPNLAAASRVAYGDTWRWDGSHWTKEQDIGPAARWGHGMVFRGDAGRVVLFGGGSEFSAQDAAVQGLHNDTWEVPDAVAQPDPGPQPTPVPPLVMFDVASVVVSPNSAIAGAIMTVTVSLMGPAPTDVQLSIGVYVDQAGWYPVGQPSGFSLPTSIAVMAGQAQASFSAVVDNATLVSAGAQYAIGVGVLGGGAIKYGAFTIIQA